MPAAPCPDTNDRCRAEDGQPFAVAGPPAAAPPDGALLLVVLVDEVPPLDEVVVGALEDVAAAGVLLELLVVELAVELEPPQADSARAAATASGARRSRTHRVLTPSTLAQPVL